MGIIFSFVRSGFSEPPVIRGEGADGCTLIFQFFLFSSENNMEAKFLGNAPCGHYKFKLPKAMRTESDIGVKVFFFKALLLTGDFSQTGKKARHVWVSKEELGDYLQPKYLAQVRRFLLDVWWTQLPVDVHTSQVLGPQEHCSHPLTGTVKRQTKFWELNVFVIVLNFDLSLGYNWLWYIASKSIMLQWLNRLIEPGRKNRGNELA